MRLIILTALMLTAITACSDDSSSNNSSNNNTPTTFECGDTTCNSATEYCATIVNAEVRDVCLTKPASCKSCDCVHIDTDLTAQTGSQDCTETAAVNMTYTCAYYDDADYIKASCTARSR